ncbi:hypothetical protein SAMN04487911_1577 [Arenibacter nanhaiticus]|uniref:Uncharacterized protein n=1 Tax=Arenibacter nanhaiticus TaxID=558155 RepID=A0A1M6N725_9FLAO|nr:hypothetical protein SAMN04487911_1577 [Arenibacter nanhaiticus]
MVVVCSVFLLNYNFWVKKLRAFWKDEGRLKQWGKNKTDASIIKAIHNLPKSRYI